MAASGHDLFDADLRGTHKLLAARHSPRTSVKISYAGPSILRAPSSGMCDSFPPPSPLNCKSSSIARWRTLAPRATRVP